MSRAFRCDYCQELVGGGPSRLSKVLGEGSPEHTIPRPLNGTRVKYQWGKNALESDSFLVVVSDSDERELCGKCWRAVMQGLLRKLAEDINGQA